MTPATPATATEPVRWRIEVRGTVQGVGFRPFVHRAATALGLAGDVRNAGSRVLITAVGPEPALRDLVAALRTRAPRHARVDAVAVTPLTDPGPPPPGFRVLASDLTSTGTADLPPDLAPCPDCLRELFDPADRRHRYPFLNCTACGPRATVVTALPYDRERTALAGFPMCARCAAEYRDPDDRRFHAEPTACPDCGPQLAWYPRGASLPDRWRGDALAAAEAVLRAGGLVAVKGVGGYQLVCDARRPAALARLRAAKDRPRKAFAVMVPDLATARALCTVDDAAAELLSGPAAPVVLLPRRPEADVSGLVAPGLVELGLFLPSSPLHHLLLADLAGPLVVTSGNRRDEPIATDDGTALRVLGPLVDGVLGHDRPIVARHDDSVTRLVAGRPAVLRRARGYAPTPLPLPVPAPEPVLALGAQLKHTAALALGDHALLGPHTGDLADAATLAAFEAGLDRLCALPGVTARVCAHDLHPGYLSSQHARRWPATRRIPVQHHHAHVAATAAEHGVRGRFIGIAYDGLGLGEDGTFWGGEVLLASYRGYRRVGRWGLAPMPGGAAAVRRPARMALGYLFGAERLGERPIPDELVAPVLAGLPDREVAVVRRLVARRLNSPLASSAGRLFEAVAALLGLGDDNSYEGEAAVLLEAAAHGCDGPALPWRLVDHDGLAVFDPVPTLRALLAELPTTPPGVLAARFHRTAAEVTVALAERAAERSGLRVVCLGGGVFQNRRLTEDVLRGLADAGFEAHVGRRVPVNDGGISYGQAAVAAALLTRR